MIKYKARIIENNSHGNIGGSNLIKTLRSIVESIKCIPSGSLSINFGNLLAGGSGSGSGSEEAPDMESLEYDYMRWRDPWVFSITKTNGEYESFNPTIFAQYGTEVVIVDYDTGERLASTYGRTHEGIVMRYPESSSLDITLDMSKLGTSRTFKLYFGITGGSVVFGNENTVIGPKEGELNIMEWNSDCAPRVRLPIPNMTVTLPKTLPTEWHVLGSMFSRANLANPDISMWDTSRVVDVGYMFENAVSFNQDLSRWCVSKIPAEQSHFASGARAWTLPKPIWGTCPGGEDMGIPDSVVENPAPPPSNDGPTDRGAGFSIQLSSNDGPFEIIRTANPEELLIILLCGSNLNIPAPDGIDPLSIITRQLGSGISINFFMVLLLSGFFGPTGDDVTMAAMYEDLFGEPFTETDPLAPTSLMGFSSSATLIGKSKNWDFLEFMNTTPSEPPLNSDGVPVDMGQVIQFQAVEKETKVTYKRSNDLNDVYSLLFGKNTPNQVTITSCSSITPKTYPLTCIPTVKRFTPTVRIQMNDAKGALALRVVYSIERHGAQGIYTEENIACYVLTTDGEGLDFYSNQNFPYPTVAKVNEDITAASVFKMLFGVSADNDHPIRGPLPENGELPDFSPTNAISGVSGIGALTTCHLLSDYNEDTNVGSIAGIFDEFATINNTEDNVPYHAMLDNVPSYIGGYSCVTSVRLEKIPNVQLPYYAKCYVTEQFGEDVTLQSCLGLGCGGSYNQPR